MEDEEATNELVKDQ